MKVHWTQNAIRQLVILHEYIALNSTTYALRVDVHYKEIDGDRRLYGMSADIPTRAKFGHYG